MDLTQLVLSAVAIVGGSLSVIVGGSYIAYKMRKTNHH